MFDAPYDALFLRLDADGIIASLTVPSDDLDTRPWVGLHLGDALSPRGNVAQQALDEVRQTLQHRHSQFAESGRGVWVLDVLPVQRRGTLLGFQVPLLLRPAASEALSSLTAGMANEFNNLLMTLMPSLDLLEQTASPDERPILADARTAADRARALVASMAKVNTPVPRVRRSQAPPQRILVIEDEVAIHRTLERALGRLGSVDVAFATTVHEGRELVQTLEEVDLVLLDRTLPDGSGSELVTDIRTHLPRASLFYFTGDTVPAAERPAVDGILTKPLSLDGLLSALGGS